MGPTPRAVILLAVAHFVLGWILSMGLVFIVLESPDTSFKGSIAGVLHGLWLVGWAPGSWIVRYVALPLWLLIPLQAGNSLAVAWLLLRSAASRRRKAR